MEIIGLGTITKVNDDFSIEFRIPGVAEECIGYPMWGESEPEVGETIMWFRLDPRALGETFIYKKITLSGDILLKNGAVEINIKKNRILMPAFLDLITAIANDLALAKSGTNLTNWMSENIKYYGNS